MASTMNAMIHPDAPTVIVERRMLDVAAVPANKKAWWRPVVTVGDGDFNPLTHKRTGPVTTIEAARVVDTYTTTPLTAQELNDAKDARVAALDRDVLMSVILNLHNRVRTLEGQSTHTMGQLRAFLRSL